jgi:hypothetical protein
MKRSYSSWFAVCALVGLCQTAGAQDTYTVSFQGADKLEAAAGQAVAPSDYILSLSHQGPGPGAQGFSLSMFADGASITAITFQGSDAAGLFSGGFEKTETSNPNTSTGACQGKSGAVTAVVLSFTLPIVLPPNQTSSMGRITLGATAPGTAGQCAAATIQFADGCRGAGQPVQNNITQEGASIIPVMQTKNVQVCAIDTPADCCSASSIIGFSSARVMSASPRDGFLGLGDLCLADEGTLDSSADTADVYASISTVSGDGVQGWSFSIEAFSNINIQAVTTAGTSGGPAPDGRQSGGFEKTEVVDPARNANRRGCVSAVVLSFTLPITLAIPSTESALKMTVAPTSEPTAETPVSGSLQFRDGLRGSGQPVNNVLTIAGASGEVCNLEDAKVTVNFLGGAPAKVFRRGDANNDFKVNIADPIWTISMLFRSGPRRACISAADSNDDGLVDLADAVYTIDYQFRGGPTPPPPFQACGEDPTEDDLACPPGSHSSCN